jgi:hypothetical protein
MIIERKADRRRSASSYFTSPVNDRRRPKFERRGTVVEAPEPVREVRLYGERRLLPDAGME